MAQPKYTAVIVTKKGAYVSAENGYTICNPTSEDRVMDGFRERPKYIYVELYSRVTEIAANTQRELEEKAWVIAYNRKLGYDFEVFLKGTSYTIYT